MKLDPYLTPYIKINSKLINNLHIRPATGKLKEENMGKKLPYIPALTSLHDYWENYNFDHTDLGWQSDIFFLIYCLGLL